MTLAGDQVIAQNEDLGDILRKFKKNYHTAGLDNKFNMTEYLITTTAETGHLKLKRT